MPKSWLLDNLRMSLIPQQRVTIHTHLRPVEVMHRIRRITDIPGPTLLSDAPHTHRPYVGDVFSTGFILTERHRWHWNRRVDLQLNGQIRVEAGLTVVEIKMEIEPVARYLIISWYGLIGLVLLIFAVGGLKSQTDKLGSLLGLIAVFAGFAVFSAIIFNIYFIPAAMKIRRDFEDLLKDIDLG